MKKYLLSFTALMASFASSSAVNIVLDYSHATSNFFDTSNTQGVVARAAVQAAADDISAAITSNLNAFSSSDYNHNGNSGGGTSIDLNGSINYTNPNSGGMESFTGSLAQNEFVVFVGARTLAGNTLGQGGMGGRGLSTGGFIGSGSTADAVAAAEASFNNAFLRGQPFIASTFNGTIAGEDYNLNLGALIGNLWFDRDTNNDGMTDSLAQIASEWHLDHTTSVAAGKNDLYSVALHEILHTLGIGGSESWRSLISGNGDPSDWNGAEAIAEHGGSGIGIIDGASDSHIENGIMSTRLSDGMVQEVVMDPNILTGTRKELTHLDLAFLRDLGFQTVPEPSTFMFTFTGLCGLLLQRRRQ